MDTQRSLSSQETRKQTPVHTCGTHYNAKVDEELEGTRDERRLSALYLTDNSRYILQVRTGAKGNRATNFSHCTQSTTSSPNPQYKSTKKKKDASNCTTQGALCLVSTLNGLVQLSSQMRVSACPARLLSLRYSLRCNMFHS